mgnify:CR=1 FL=1
MRITEIITEGLEIPRELPNLLYHGTSRRRLHGIMKDGLKPKLNKWKWLNMYQGQYPGRPGYVPPTPEQKAEDTVISATKSFDHALSYAQAGGSTGWRSDNDKRDAVVLAFKPLPSDKLAPTMGYDADYRFYNKITPDRLKIVYPERLVGQEQHFITKGQTLTDANAKKAAMMKEINKKLKQAGSIARIASHSYGQPRWDVYLKQGQQQIKDWPAMTPHGTPDVVDMTSPAFQTWLTNQLRNPTTG